MNIVIPMAGQGSRFISAGYNIPKPFIPIKGKPMIEWVIDNIGTEDDTFYLICRLEHLEYLTNSSLPYKNNIAFIPIIQPTEGAACTVLHAEKFINNYEPLLIANSDQYVVYDKEAWKQTLQDHPSGNIMTFDCDHPKWSYAKIDKGGGMVTRVAEKQVISNHATVGVYYFGCGADFVDAAKKMIRKNIRTNNEFYVCPIYNELIEHVDIYTFDVDKMYGMGTPEDLRENYDMIGI